MDSQPLEQKDRDILIKLETTVNLQHVETIGKIEDLKAQVRSIADGTATQLMNHETRMQSLEKSRDQLADLKVTDLSLANNKRIQRLSDVSKLIAGLLTAMGGIIIWLLLVINNLLQIKR